MAENTTDRRVRKTRGQLRQGLVRLMREKSIQDITVKELCELEGEINHMQEKLAQADQAERTFFQNASHELRTPLMSISGSPVSGWNGAQ